jgi:hypothetical protein
MMSVANIICERGLAKRQAHPRRRWACQIVSGYLEPAADFRAFLPVRERQSLFVYYCRNIKRSICQQGDWSLVRQTGKGGESFRPGKVPGETLILSSDSA